MRTKTGTKTGTKTDSILGVVKRLPRRGTRAAAALVGLALALATSKGTAQEPATPQAAAEALFAEGRTLLAQGQREAACKKFDESYRVDRAAMGTLFNLALCNERLGRFATAWLQFREVTARSRATRPDRAELSEGRAAAIEPRFSKLRVVVPEAVRRIEGLAVTLDGAAIPPASFGTWLPVDGGVHVLLASAKGHVAVTFRPSVAKEKGNVEVTVPLLEPGRADAASTPVAATGATPPRSTLGWVLGAGGVTALAVGAGFGVSVLVRSSDTKDDALPLAERQSTYRELDAQAYVADGAAALGVTLLVASAVLLLTPTKAASTSARRPAAALSF